MPFCPSLSTRHFHPDTHMRRCASHMGAGKGATHARYILTEATPDIETSRRLFLIELQILSFDNILY